MTRATGDLMDALHGLTAETFTAEIKRLRAAGEPVPPALLAATLKFLKDNGVDSPGRSSPKIDRLAAELDDVPLDELRLN